MCKAPQEMYNLQPNGMCIQSCLALDEDVVPHHLSLVQSPQTLGFPETGSQGHRVTGSQGHGFMGSWGHRVIGS